MSRDKFNWKDAQRLANTRGCALRAELASYIREKAAAFKPFWLPPEEPQTEAERLNLKQAEGGEPLYTWEAYLAGLDRPKRWVDDIAIRATTKRLNCRVIVVVGSVDKPSQIISFGKKIDWEDRPQVVIPLLYSDKHYQLIVPKQGHSLPQAWIELELGSTSVVPRGGGKPLPCGSLTSSRRSPKCWLPSRAPSVASSSGTRAAKDAWLPPRVASSASATSCGRRALGRWLPSRAPSVASSCTRAAKDAWLPPRAASSDTVTAQGGRLSPKAPTSKLRRSLMLLLPWETLRQLRFGKLRWLEL